MSQSSQSQSQSQPKLHYIEELLSTFGQPLTVVAVAHIVGPAYTTTSKATPIKGTANKDAVQKKELRLILIVDETGSFPVSQFYPYKCDIQKGHVYEFQIQSRKMNNKDINGRVVSARETDHVKLQAWYMESYESFNENFPFTPIEKIHEKKPFGLRISLHGTVTLTESYTYDSGTVKHFCNLDDGTGTIGLIQWEEEKYKFEETNKIFVRNAKCTEWKTDVQITIDDGTEILITTKEDEVNEVKSPSKSPSKRSTFTQNQKNHNLQIKKPKLEFESLFDTVCHRIQSTEINEETSKVILLCVENSKFENLDEVLVDYFRMQGELKKLLMDKLRSTPIDNLFVETAFKRIIANYNTDKQAEILNYILSLNISRPANPFSLQEEKEEDVNFSDEGKQE